MVQESNMDNSNITEEDFIRGYWLSRYCNGIMGVPITFLDKYNPKQFKIIGESQRGCHSENMEIRQYNDYWEVKQDGTKTGASGGKTNGNPNLLKNDGKHNYFINKNGRIIQSCYQRIFIRRRDKNNE